MPSETSFNRSQGQSRDGESNLLASIPAPLDTLSILRRRASTASISEMSERSLTLNERESSTLHSPSAAANFSSPRGNHGGMVQPGPTTISRLLFNALSKRSGATSPFQSLTLALLLPNPWLNQILSFRSEPPCCGLSLWNCEPISRRVRPLHSHSSHASRHEYSGGAHHQH